MALPFNEESLGSRKSYQVSDVTVTMGSFIGINIELKIELHWT